MTALDPWQILHEARANVELAERWINVLWHIERGKDWRVRKHAGHRQQHALCAAHLIEPVVYERNPHTFLISSRLSLSFVVCRRPARLRGLKPVCAGSVAANRYGSSRPKH